MIISMIYYIKNIRIKLYRLKKMFIKLFHWIVYIG
jgi:hypothetical protein